MYVCMCIYVCMCVCMCVHACMYEYVWICMCVCLSVCMYVCMYVCMHLFLIHSLIYSFIDLFIHSSIPSCVCLFIYALILVCCLFMYLMVPSKSVWSWGMTASRERRVSSGTLLMSMSSTRISPAQISISRNKPKLADDLPHPVFPHMPTWNNASTINWSIIEICKYLNNDTTLPKNHIWQELIISKYICYYAIHTNNGLIKKLVLK